MAITDQTGSGRQALTARMKRVAWFVGLWLSGVVVIGIIGGLMKLLLAV